MTVDLGAESLLARRPEALDLAVELGLGDDVVHPATSRAAVWSRGALHPMPTGTVMGVPSDASALAGLLTADEVRRASTEVVSGPVADDVGVAELVADRLGQAVVDRLVDPLLGGVYAVGPNGSRCARPSPHCGPRLATAGRWARRRRAGGRGGDDRRTRLRGPARGCRTTGRGVGRAAAGRWCRGAHRRVRAGRLGRRDRRHPRPSARPGAGRPCAPTAWCSPCRRRRRPGCWPRSCPRRRPGSATCGSPRSPSSPPCCPPERSTPSHRACPGCWCLPSRAAWSRR